MAGRRMIWKKISISEQVNNLSTFAALLFTWMVAHADDFGRLPGSTKQVKALVVPMQNVTEDDVQQALLDMEQENLIQRYEVDGHWFINFPNWDKYQKLPKRTTSDVPAPPNGSEALSASESEIEEFVAWNLRQGSMKFTDEEVALVERQVRLDNYYVDIQLVTTTGRTYAIEVKRSKLTDAALKQILRYRAAYESKGVIDGIYTLIGYGLASNFPLSEAKDEGINVISYDDQMQFSPITLPTVQFSYSPLINETSTVFNGMSQENRGEENLTELNATEVKDSSSPLAKVAQTFEAEGFGQITSLISEQLVQMVDEFGGPWVIEAMREAVLRGKRRLNYVQSILTNWKADGGMRRSGGGVEIGITRRGTKGPAGQIETTAADFIRGIVEPGAADV